MITIRRALIQDLKTLTNIWFTGYCRDYKSECKTLEMFPAPLNEIIHQIATHLTLPDLYVWLAEYNGLPAGYMIFSIVENQPVFRYPKVCIINEAVVDPKFRKLGVWTALLNNARKFAAEQDIKEIMFYTANINKEALKAWTKNSNIKQVVTGFAISTEETK